MCTITVEPMPAASDSTTASSAKITPSWAIGAGGRTLSACRAASA